MLDNIGNSYLITTDGKISPTGFPPTLGAGKIAVDSKGRVYLMGLFNLIRISPDGKQETIVAMPTQPGVPPPGFGPTSLGGLGTDPTGNVYFTGTYLGAPTSYVFRVNDDGTLTTVYGSAATPLYLRLRTFPRRGFQQQRVDGHDVRQCRGAYSLGQPYPGYSGDGGPAQSARFNFPAGVFAPNGDLYLLDGIRIRKLTGLTPVKPAAIAGGAIVNALSYTGGAISPGELISIFGSGFAASGLQVNALENNGVPWVLGPNQGPLRREPWRHRRHDAYTDQRLRPVLGGARKIHRHHRTDRYRGVGARSGPGRRRRTRARHRRSIRLRPGRHPQSGFFRQLHRQPRPSRQRDFSLRYR